MIDRQLGRPCGTVSAGLLLCLLALVLAAEARGGEHSDTLFSQKDRAAFRQPRTLRQLRVARLRQSLEAQRLRTAQVPLWPSLDVPDLPKVLPYFDEASAGGSSGFFAHRMDPSSSLEAQQSRGEWEVQDVLSWQRGRLLQSSPAAQAPAPAAPANLSALLVVLAQSRTERVNPLDSFKVYRSGWNPSSTGYWASTAWTAVYAPLIGLAWILLGLGFVLFLISLRFCFPDLWDTMRESHSYTAKELYVPLGFAIFGVCMALTGFGLLVAGGVYFNDNMQRIGDGALDITTSVASLVSNIGLLVKDVAGIPVVSQSLPVNVKQSLIGNAEYVNYTVNNVVNVVASSKDKLYKYSYMLLLMLLIVGCIDVGLVLATMVAALLRWVVTTNTFCTIIWIFTLFSWLFIAVFLVCAVAFADTSTAMYQVAASPDLPSAMNDWVPCLNNQRIGQAARFAAYTAIKLLNQEVTEKFPRALQILQVDSICAPFGPPDNFTYDPSLCGNNTITVKQFAEVVLNHTCPDGLNTCKPGKPLPIDGIITVENATQLIASLESRLESMFPRISALQNCTYVAEIAQWVGQMSNNLQQDSLDVWLGFTFIAVGSMVLAMSLPSYVFRAVRSEEDEDDDEEGGNGEYDPTKMYPSGPVYANASGPVGPYISGPMDHSVSQGPYATPNPSGFLTPGGRPLAEQQQQQQSGSSHMAPIQQQHSRDEVDDDDDEEEEEYDGHEVVTASVTSGSDSEPPSSHRRRQ